MPRLPLGRAHHIASTITEDLWATGADVFSITPVGSLRRFAPDVGDVSLLAITEGDLHAVLDAAARRGLGNGYTVPAHVPGEVNGSCSFATARGRRLQVEHLATAQLVGSFAFEAARRLVRRDHQKQADPARFSDRERDCLIWIARGKSDSEIATILGISPETVHQYVKQARGNYDAVSRSQLVAHALFNGTISFMDIFKRWNG